MRIKKFKAKLELPISSDCDYCEDSIKKWLCKAIAEQLVEYGRVKYSIKENKRGLVFKGFIELKI